MTKSDHQSRWDRALCSLEGLSVGDAFGETFFISPELIEQKLAQRELSPAPWVYTDDTEMALAILEVIEEQGSVNQNALAEVFARRFQSQPGKGYGPMAQSILQAFAMGVDWQIISRRVFDGQGSMGNGGAMRAAPLGAYFADDLNAVVEQARASAEVTHAHPEGQAGAIAIAVAAATIVQNLQLPDQELIKLMFDQVIELTPSGETYQKIEQASRLDFTYDVQTAVNALGNGSKVISQDTVGFSLWCVGKYLHSFEEAMWGTVSGLGDRDTTCAIVGGIVVLRTGTDAIPREWIAAREPLQFKSS